jgi:DNA-binding transcriptional ArsR family regulator
LTTRPRTAPLAAWASTALAHPAQCALPTRLLFDSLHATAHCAGDRLVVDDGTERVVSVGGRGFPLMPTVFADRGPLLSVSDWSAPVAIYPVRAIATLWEGRPRAIGADPVSPLAAVLGPARARLLTLLQAPATTTELAHRTGLSVGAVSQHLSALHNARLVRRNRQGRSVYYLSTELGAFLVSGGPASGAQCD